MIAKRFFHPVVSMSSFASVKGKGKRGEQMPRARGYFSFVCSYPRGDWQHLVVYRDCRKWQSTLFDHLYHCLKPKRTLQLLLFIWLRGQFERVFFLGIELAQTEEDGVRCACLSWIFNSTTLKWVDSANIIHLKKIGTTITWSVVPTG